MQFWGFLLAAPGASRKLLVLWSSKPKDRWLENLTALWKPFLGPAKNAKNQSPN